MKLFIHTDGGSRGNPGPAASGAVLKDVNGKVLDTIAKYLGSTTNNQAEYTAIVIGLERAKAMGATVAEVVMDSELAVKQLNGQYRVKNPELGKRYREVMGLVEKFARVTFRHVRREQNVEADAAVNACLDSHGTRKSEYRSTKF